MVGERDFRGGIRGKSCSRRCHFCVVTVPVVGIDRHQWGHSLGTGLRSGRANRAGDVGGVIIIGRRRISFHDPIRAEFLMGVSDGTAIPHAHPDARSVQIVRGRLANQVGTRGDGGIGVESVAIDWLVPAEVMQDADFVSRAVETHWHTQLLCLGQHRSITDRFTLLQIGRHGRPGFRMTQISALQNLGDRKPRIDFKRLGRLVWNQGSRPIKPTGIWRYRSRSSFGLTLALGVGLLF